MLEILITAGIVAGVIVGAFVGLVALLVFLVGAMVASWWVLDKVTSIGSAPWVPSENQTQEAYKAYIENIREAATYGTSLFGPTKKEKGS